MRKCPVLEIYIKKKKKILDNLKWLFFVLYIGFFFPSCVKLKDTAWNHGQAVERFS